MNSAGLPKKKKSPPQSAPPHVRRIGSLINQLISRRGYAQVTVVNELESAIVAVLDPSLRGSVRVGNLRQGVLQLYATDSVTLQELNFQKRAILKGLNKAHPQAAINDLRFRIQAE